VLRWQIGNGATLRAREIHKKIISNFQSLKFFGEGVQVVNDTGIEAFEQRQCFSAHATSQKSRIVVGGITCDADRMAFNVQLDVAPTCLKQRTQQRQIAMSRNNRLRAHRRKSTRPTTAQQPEQHGFGLIVRVMPGGDRARDHLFACYLCERIVTSLARIRV
jgi:hypothetical protein